MGLLQKIADIEQEISRTQKNKATEYHLGILKAKLARYRHELLEIKTSASSSSGGPSFEVSKSGDARVALIGFPSVGKSTLLNAITSTKSACASYEFTTLTCIPGNITFLPDGGTVQLLDLPGIIPGAAQGKGRGRQVISTARTADCLVMMIDATKSLEQKALLQAELEAMGLRLNKRRPNIYFNPKLDKGGVSFTSTTSQAHLTESLVTHILKEYKMHNAEVIVRDADCSIDDFIDVVDGTRVYMPCLFVYNKIDQLTMEEIDRLSRDPHSLPISCEQSLNLDMLKSEIWRLCRLTRVYTKKPGQFPDLDEPVILRYDSNEGHEEDDGATVLQLCQQLHKDLASSVKYALVWGCSVKHQPQRVGLQHTLQEGDVVQLCKK